MGYDRGQWIIDSKNKKPLWITAIAEDVGLLMGWGIKRHSPVWLSCTMSTDKPRVLQEHEVEQLITAEYDTEGYTAFKTVMQNPDDYLFKNATQYGIEDPLLVSATLLKVYPRIREYDQTSQQ